VTLAERANLTLRQIGDIKRGTMDPRASILAAIEEFLEVNDIRGGGRG
jgi:predicted transcriptional regulator